MIVYNSNASITGSVTYPAYGAGLYQWDGTGWVAPSRTPIVLCSGNGTVSATTTNNTPTAQLDLGTEYIQTADVTISGNNKITFNTPGTYKIDAAVICNFTSNNTSSTGLIFFALPKNSAPGQYFYYAAGPVQAGSNSTLNVNYLMQGSYIVSMALNDYIYIKGDTYAIGSYNAQILSLQITRIK